MQLICFWYFGFGYTVQRYILVFISLSFEFGMVLSILPYYLFAVYERSFSNYFSIEFFLFWNTIEDCIFSVMQLMSNTLLKPSVSQEKIFEFETTLTWSELNFCIENPLTESLFHFNKFIWISCRRVINNIKDWCVFANVYKIKRESKHSISRLHVRFLLIKSEPI